jgi:hypothetical protein
MESRVSADGQAPWPWVVHVPGGPVLRLSHAETRREWVFTTGPARGARSVIMCVRPKPRFARTSGNLGCGETFGKFVANV